MIAIARKTGLGMKAGCRYETRRNKLGKVVVIIGDGQPNLVASEEQLKGYAALVPGNCA